MTDGTIGDLFEIDKAFKPAHIVIDILGLGG
jgi:hypothetical protein